MQTAAATDYIAMLKRLETPKAPCGGLFFCCPPKGPIQSDLENANKFRDALLIALDGVDASTMDENFRVKTYNTLKKYYLGRGGRYDNDFLLAHVKSKRSSNAAAQLLHKFNKYYFGDLTKETGAEDAALLREGAESGTESVGARAARACALPMTSAGLIDTQAMRRG